MENGASDLAYQFAALAVNGPIDNGNDGLFQVMKAVEAAEATIKQQVEENNRLRSELAKKNHELDKYKVDDLKGRRSINYWNDHDHGPPRTHQSDYVLSNQIEGDSTIKNSSVNEQSGMLGQREDATQTSLDAMARVHEESHFGSSTVNGAQRMFLGNHTQPENAVFSQYPSPPTTSASPSRYQLEGKYDPQFNLSAHGLMPMADVANPDNPLKQDLAVKSREHEQEILQLRKHLAEYSMKEVQLRNENLVLEKRIAYMRMAFDQQQQELVDAASKAIAYRQDIIEENIRLSYALQEAQQERSTFVSSLMPLIAEYSYPQPVADAQSIVSNLKFLFKHLQEKLNITEAKLKESQYQMAPWRSDINLANFAHSPTHSLGKNGLELVPQPLYSNGELALSSDIIKTRDWDVTGQHKSIVGGGATKNLDTDDFGRYSPSRNTVSEVPPVQLAVSQGNSRPHNGETTSSKQVTFSDTVSSSEMDDPDLEGYLVGRDSSAMGSKNSPYGPDDPSSSNSPYLAPVLEEPSSSFSEAADDDPLPAVEGLQISGEAFPGRELQATGYSINGTTTCNFEWVRHLEDGSVKYIDGAKQPSYLVSADDIDTCLAIEVQPMDDQKRKGELVKVFANEHRKITCDPEMHNLIKKTLYNGHASYMVSQSFHFLDMWEPAMLIIKKEGFSIKGTGTSAGLVTEKFSPATVVTIPCGNPTEFSIIGSGGVEHLLRAENSHEDITCCRDTIVLTLRLFIIRAGDKKKGKKKVLFFNK